ncbi:uncharacterized protein PV09_07120 [Verruconis gallopava]|uniref:F-box domain-containing protein n=1 Tax=Verruconis gallopava TaxID=253628 RepID=A0A0D2A3E6_9PEZI|nr:uncharacterized protein PV09_07120 [Verruconis gallopava]KIW01348.1 hypothetical protein PV09_07120 [Verruconis gallopava]
MSPASPAIGYQHMAGIFSAVWGIKAMSDAVNSGQCFTKQAILDDRAPLQVQSDQTPRSRPVHSIAMSLPSEIIQHVYSYMHPRDFNAARHTCRTWMIASLNNHILCSMLRRGAWWSGYRSHVQEATLFVGRFQSLSARRIWSMSCFISRECALAGGWTGNDLSRVNYPAMATCDHHWGQCQKPSCWASRRSITNVEVFRQVTRTNFEDLAAGYKKRSRRRELIFTVSSCGNYVLVAEGGMIYVYEIFGDNLHVLTRVICPRRVLAMSINASSRRFAIAAVLEGRMGLMCSFLVRTYSGEDFVNTASGIVAEQALDLHDPSDVASTNSRGIYPQRSTDVFEIQSGSAKETVADDQTELGRESVRINRTWNSHVLGINVLPETKNTKQARSTLLANGSRSFYHQLCFEDDPPRSVAICPQRQCVAFGCSTGLDLHWIDALSGQDLNRWFPLTVPSDHLYFFPPRPKIDSLRRIQLISSAAHPSQRASIARRFELSRAQTQPLNTNPFWGSIDLENRIPVIEGFVGGSDHYRAVPMTDGVHILFTDPKSGMLCLGSDAQSNEQHRLMRKIIFIPPSSGAIPRLYSASASTSSGPRIVAAYDDEVVLYSVPSDVFELSSKQQYGAITAVDLDAAATWLSWWPEEDALKNFFQLSVSPDSDTESQSIWPLGIRGVHVGNLRCLVELSINTVSGILSIWGFGADGEALVWQIDDGSSKQYLKEHIISHDGQIMDSYQLDPDGDVVMRIAEDIEFRAESSSS